MYENIILLTQSINETNIIHMFFFYFLDKYKRMSDSFAAQLANAKLKPSKDKTKDFSDPKLAGEFEIEISLIYMIEDYVEF